LQSCCRAKPLLHPGHSHRKGRSAVCERKCPLKLNLRVNVLPHPGTGHTKCASLRRLLALAAWVALVVTCCFSTCRMGGRRGRPAAMACDPNDPCPRGREDNGARVGRGTAWLWYGEELGDRCWSGELVRASRPMAELGMIEGNGGSTGGVGRDADIVGCKMGHVPALRGKREPEAASYGGSVWRLFSSWVRAAGATE